MRDKGRFVCLDCETKHLGAVIVGGNFPCFKCGKTLVGTTVVHNQHEYHKTCFGCIVCGVGFGSDGYLTNNAGEPVCDDHVNSSAAPRAHTDASMKPLMPSKPAKGGLSLDTLAQMGMLDDDDDDELANKRPLAFEQASPLTPSKKASSSPPPPPPGRRR